ncbi:hypothetical protein [Virgibacillus kimchii]
MIAEMYKRREKLGYFFLGYTILIMLWWIIFQTPNTSGEWLEMLVFLVPLGFIFSIIIMSRSHYKSVKDIAIPHSQQEILDLNHVVIKKDAAFTPRLLLFENNGHYIGMIKPVMMPWWMYPFQFFYDALLQFLPLTYGFISHKGETLFTFRKKGWLKQTKLTIFNRDKKKIGIYVQEELKSLFQIKGTLFNEQKKQILSIKASGFSGSFSWNDEEGNQWAYFYNGKFPHEYTNLFRDIQNDIVALSDTLSKEDKIRLLAIIGYLFIIRMKQ